MTRADLKDKILNYFIPAWGSTCYVAYDNINFTPPNNTKWMRFSIRNNDSNPISIGLEGNRRYDRYGFIFFQVFIPGDVGTYDGDQLCETIINLFEGKRLEQIYFSKATYSEVGKEDVWFQYNGRIEWEFIEVK